jgi:hypothetical protein
MTVATTGVSSSTEQVIEEMHQDAVNNTALTGANANFQTTMADHDVANNAMASATSAAAAIGRTN